MLSTPDDALECAPVSTAVDDDDIEEVEIEIEKVVAYLYRQLQSNSEDYLRFARISIEDLDLELNNVDQLRGAVVQGVTASAADKSRVQTSLEQEDDRVLPKLVTVFFQLLELDTHEDNFEDVAEAFVQLLDALQTKGVLEDIGGGDYLVQLAESVPTAVNAPHYARIVSEKHKLRHLIDAAGQG